MALKSDGTIVLAGNAGDFLFFVAGLLPNGQVFTDIGSNGNGISLVSPWINNLLPSNVSTEFVRSINIQADGKMILVGGGVAVRVNYYGLLDNSFGILGRSRLDQPLGATGGGALQFDGSLICVGYLGSKGGQSNLIVSRRTANGQVDPTFDQDGTLSTQFLSQHSDDRLRTIATAPDGKIVVAGVSRRPSWMAPATSSSLVTSKTELLI